ARSNLASEPNVEVLHGDGTSVPFRVADVIYVNAGVTHAADHWLDRLSRDGGRLILPLTTGQSLSGTLDQINRGVVFLIERYDNEYRARCISNIAVFPCAGSRDSANAAALAAALRKGGMENVTRLHRHSQPPLEQCWLRGSGWSLAYS